jgi:hypothetical protein
MHEAVMQALKQQAYFSSVSLVDVPRSETGISLFPPCFRVSFLQLSRNYEYFGLLRARSHLEPRLSCCRKVVISCAMQLFSSIYYLIIFSSVLSTLRVVQSRVLVVAVGMLRDMISSMEGYRNGH